MAIEENCLDTRLHFWSKIAVASDIFSIAQEVSRKPFG